MSAFYNPKMKRAIVTSANPNLKKWRKIMSAAFESHRKATGHSTVKGPCVVSATFFMPRLKNHPRKGDERFWKATKPDLDKLQRALHDSLETAQVFETDSRVVVIQTQKRYAGVTDEPGVLVSVREIRESDLEEVASTQWQPTLQEIRESEGGAAI